MTLAARWNGLPTTIPGFAESIACPSEVVSMPGHSAAPCTAPRASMARRACQGTQSECFPSRQPRRSAASRAAAGLRPRRAAKGSRHGECPGRPSGTSEPNLPTASCGWPPEGCWAVRNGPDVPSREDPEGSAVPSIGERRCRGGGFTDAGLRSSPRAAPGDRRRHARRPPPIAEGSGDPRRPVVERVTLTGNVPFWWAAPPRHPQTTEACGTLERHHPPRPP